ncbi:MAG: hypothetical protein NVS4B12_03560 [Ktedonobacteraceae bacterium]
MQRPKNPPPHDFVTVAERVLSETFGSSIQLGEGEDLQDGIRSQVYRFNIMNNPSNAPRSVIVKQVKSSKESIYTPDRATVPAWTLFNEWASLQFISEIADETPFAPRFYGGDRTAGLIAMEDLGPGTRLDQILMSSDPVAAESALVEFATIHGRLHARSIGKQNEFNRLRDALGPSAPEDGHYSYDWLAPTFYQTVALLGITPEPDVETELEILKASTLHPDSFLTFVQQDSCPDNCLFNHSGLQLLDFEGGRFDHALKGGVYGRMRFPTCWCVYQMPEDIHIRMESAYRAELIKGCSDAADDTLFYHAVAEACVYWMLEWYKLDPLAKNLAKDRYIIAATGRQRYLMRSDVVAKTTEEARHMQAIGVTIRAMAVKMRELWSDVEVPYYPAFR